MIVKQSSRTVPVEHRFVGGSAGGPGECSARCSCGTGFYGFDSSAEASACLAQHIADAPAEWRRWRRLVNRVAPRRAKNRVAAASRRVNRKRGA